MAGRGKMKEPDPKAPESSGPKPEDFKVESGKFSDLTLGQIWHYVAKAFLFLDRICSEDEKHGPFWIFRALPLSAGLLLPVLFFLVVEYSIKSSWQDVRIMLATLPVEGYILISFIIFVIGFALSHHNQSYCRCFVKGLKLSIVFSLLVFMVKGFIP